jgi:hypothetical protein
MDAKEQYNYAYEAARVYGPDSLGELEQLVWMSLGSCSRLDIVAAAYASYKARWDEDIYANEQWRWLRMPTDWLPF